MPLQEKIKVEILNRSYDLNIEGITEIEANALANQVTERIEELQRATRVVDTSRLAVLAALNFADELRRLQAKHADLLEAARRRMDKMKKILDDASK